MAYLIKKIVTDDPMSIDERKYNTQTEIKFTAFTSCIGVIARTGNLLTAVHLSMTYQNGNKFDTNAVKEIMTIIGQSYNEVKIIGCVDIWKNPSNGISVPYNNLWIELNRCPSYNFIDGTYGAKVDNDKGKLSIEITF